MPLRWPAITQTGGDLPEERQGVFRALLDRYGECVEALLRDLSLPPHASPLFRPWNLIAVQDAEKLIAVFCGLGGGVAEIRWLDLSTQIVRPEAIVHDVQAQLGWPVQAVAVLPLTNPDEAAEGGIELAATRHVEEVERAMRLGRLGDLAGFLHLESFLRAFLEDHPEPERNVFLMMRFLQTEQMVAIHQTIRTTLQERGYHAVRADDRDYTGELWSNIEVCMLGCHLGVAVFEDIEERAFNPNVSLELGWMLGRRTRCLILKERRLPDLPTDVIGRLYKTFDAFNIGETVRAQVLQWVDVDLGGAGRAP